jgi:serine/threonine protein kinase
MRNSKIDQTSAEVKDLINANFNKITEQCDIYGIGAILYRLLLGETPDHEISRRINDEKMHLEDPE